MSIESPIRPSRRAMLRNCSAGFGSLALLDLMAQKARAAAPEALASAFARAPQFPARAKRIIFLFMHGGPSSIDTFDYKPKLQKDAGKPLPFAKPRVQFSQTGNLLASPWKFAQHGQSGAWISELFPHVAACADDLCVVKSIYGSNEAHGGALLKIHTGSDTFVRPSMGSWLSYGLGSENSNMPSFITMNPSLGHGGVQNFSAAFLPAIHQATRLTVDTTGAKISHLANKNIPDGVRRRELQLLREINQDQLKQTGPDKELEGRIESFELAFRMQTQAPDLLDITSETDATKKLYGIGEKPTEVFGRQCLLARRFAEAGVRFIQCTHGYWDQHADLKAQHTKLAAEVDKPIAGLLRDLKSRGLLDETLVVWGGEFGRTPTAQGTDGRDHNPHGFTYWLAGGGAKPGTTFGETDDYGFYVANDKVHVHDLHATLLYLMGLDHEKLTYRYAGRDFRLTDVEGNVVKQIIA
jgi:hypothetical protein